LYGYLAGHPKAKYGSGQDILATITSLRPIMCPKTSLKKKMDNQFVGILKAQLK
jgi:hypothetical protein